jgi:hypothetical protein
LSGYDEVCSVFENAYERFQGRIHVTLVALGVTEKTAMEYVVDKVIPVPDEKLTDYGEVTNQIAVYVASCIRERRKILERA